MTPRAAPAAGALALSLPGSGSLRELDALLNEVPP
jgi:hypothetical protein